MSGLKSYEEFINENGSKRNNIAKYFEEHNNTPILKLEGHSGKKYSFYLCSYPDVLDKLSKNDELNCVYIITNRYNVLTKHKNKIIYIGITDNLKTRHYSHHNSDCFDSNNANCIGIYYENYLTENKRREIEKDLIFKYNPVCNIQHSS